MIETEKYQCNHTQEKKTERVIEIQVGDSPILSLRSLRSTSFLARRMEYLRDLRHDMACHLPDVGSVRTPFKMLRTRPLSYRELNRESSSWRRVRFPGIVYNNIVGGQASGGRACLLIEWPTTAMSIIITGRPGMADLYTRIEADVAPFRFRRFPILPCCWL